MAVSRPSRRWPAAPGRLTDGRGSASRAWASVTLPTGRRAPAAPSSSCRRGPWLRSTSGAAPPARARPIFSRRSARSPNCTPSSCAAGVRPAWGRRRRDRASSRSAASGTRPSTRASPWCRAPSSTTAGLGDPTARPRPATATRRPPPRPNDRPRRRRQRRGPGTGATVGKILGEAGWMKGGVGVATIDASRAVRVTALTVVNAFGDVLDEAGAVLAGARLRRPGFRRHSPPRASASDGHPHFDRMAEATTLSVVVTDAALTKTQCAVVGPHGPRRYGPGDLACAYPRRRRHRLRALGGRAALERLPGGGRGRRCRRGEHPAGRAHRRRPLGGAPAVRDLEAAP